MKRAVSTAWISVVRACIVSLYIMLSGGLCARAEDPDSVAFANAGWKTKVLYKGAVAMSARIRMFDSMQSVNVIRYHSSDFRTEIINAEGEVADKTSAIGRKAVARFALNGSYFNMDGRINTVYLRIGDMVLARTRHYEMYRANGVLALSNPSGTDILIAYSDTTQYESVAGSYDSVMAAGPILLNEGEIRVLPPHVHDPVIKKSGDYGLVYDQRHPRSVIGIDDEGYIYMVVIDGRFKRKAHGTTMWETARICKLLGMSVAINLDGGGSSTLWAREAGILNHPCRNRIYNRRGERRIPSAIVAL